MEQPHLPQSHQQREVDLVSVSQDLQDAVQVDLVFTEAPCSVRKEASTS